MASEDERDAADGAKPRTSGSAKRVKTAGGKKVEIHDVWTSRVSVTTVFGATLYLAYRLNNPKKKWKFGTHSKG